MRTMHHGEIEDPCTGQRVTFTARTEEDLDQAMQEYLDRNYPDPQRSSESRAAGACASEGKVVVPCTGCADRPECLREGACVSDYHCKTLTFPRRPQAVRPR